MNGTIELELNGRKVTVIGGPYREKPKGVIGVKLAQEIDAPYDLKLDIPDFSVPDRNEAFLTTLEAIDLLDRNGIIYVGCMGGIGRTGLFMALIVKGLGYYNIERECTGWRGFINNIKKFFGMDHGAKYCADMIRYPVEFVRKYYMPHAVETQEQYEFVQKFEFKDFDVNALLNQ